MTVFYDAECVTCKEGITKKDGKWGHDSGRKNHVPRPRQGSVVRTEIK